MTKQESGPGALPGNDDYFLTGFAMGWFTARYGRRWPNKKRLVHALADFLRGLDVPPTGDWLSAFARMQARIDARSKAVVK